MLEGVEILNFEVIPIIETTIEIFIVGTIIALIVSLVIGKYYDANVGVILFVVGFGVSAIVSNCTEKVVGEEVLYQVTISDKVNLAELSEKYEILNQNGKIYIIKERKSK